jgi:hypothetical protein
MHTSTAPKNLIFPSRSVGEKSIRARQNTSAQFLIPFVIQVLIPFVIQAKKEAPSRVRGRAACRARLLKRSRADTVARFARFLLIGRLRCRRQGAIRGREIAMTFDRLAAELDRAYRR